MPDEELTYSADRGARRGSSTIRPHEFRCRPLATELAELWLRSARALSWRVSTAAASAVAIRSFVRFVDESPVESATSLFRGDDLGSQFVAWSAAMRSKRKRKLVNRVRLLMERAHFEGSELQPMLQLLVTQTHLSRAETQAVFTPLEEYSNAERIHQTRTATESIERAERRIELGLVLFDSSPTLRRLLSLAFSHPSYSAVADELLRHPRLFNEVRVLTGLEPNDAGRYAPREVVVAVASLLGPTRMELVSYRILLQWATGFAPEQVRQCQVSDVRFGSHGVHWRTEKARSSTTFEPEFEGTQPWQVAGLLARAIKATARMRQMLGGDDLLVTFAVQSRKTHALRLVAAPRTKPGMKEWIAHHGLRSSEPHDLRRIRKAHSAVRAGVAPRTDLMKEPDHTVSTFDRHYSSGVTSKTMAARTVVRAQHGVVEHVVSRRATVVASTAANIANDPEREPTLRNVAGAVASQPEVERALGASACSAPQASPFADAGAWCESAPFTCMLCPNAVIFDDHAPQLLLMKKALVDQQRSLRPDEYARQTHPYVVAIDSYLDQMDVTTLTAAEAAGSAGIEKFAIPLTKRITL